MINLRTKKISKDSRIVLVMPSYKECVKSLFIFHENQSIGSKPPLGLMSIAAYLKSEGFSSIEIFDASLENLSPGQTAARLARMHPDIVGFSVMTDVWYNTVRTCELVKQMLPDAMICLGGSHASIYPELSLAASRADMLVAGDGEFAFREALEKLMAGNPPDGINGVFWKDLDGGIRMPAVNIATMEDLDALPAPDRSMINNDAYSSLLSPMKSTTMITSRGCPCRCVFCKLNVQKVVSRSPWLVVDEFEDIAKAGFENIEIYDDTFTWQRERVLEICKEIVRKGIKIEWSVRSRVDKVDHEMLVAMKKAGCRRIHFGIESGNELILKASRKGITKDQARNAVRMAQKLKFTVLTYYLVGFLDETLQDAQETYRLARELHTSYVAFALLIPYPGTAIYQEALARGIIPEDHWNAFTQNPVPDYTIPYLVENNVSRETMLQFVNNAHLKYYLRPRRLLQELTSIRSPRDFARKVDMGKKIMKNFTVTLFNSHEQCNKKNAKK
jgi:radical SAM superfamily enzyme YgiQ (UPF0313 family)